MVSSGRNKDASKVTGLIAYFAELTSFLVEMDGWCY